MRRCAGIFPGIGPEAEQPELEGGTGKVDISNDGRYTNYAYEHVAHSETEHLA